MRQIVLQNFFPEGFSIVPIDCECDILLTLGDGAVVVSARCTAVFGCQLLPVRNCRSQKNSIAPDDRCRMPFSWYLNLPTNIFIFTPLGRWVRVYGYSSTTWPAPLAPIWLFCKALFSQADDDRNGSNISNPNWATIGDLHHEHLS